jgi:hypothetical protein
MHERLEALPCVEATFQASEEATSWSDAPSREVAVGPRWRGLRGFAQLEASLVAQRGLLLMQ